MKNYFEQIEKKLKSKIKYESIEIINNSHLHKSHKFYSKDKFHLHIKLKSSFLCSMSRLNAQRLIMKILDSDLKTKIHALEITIQK